MPDQFPSHWTPAMKAEAQRRMGSGAATSDDDFPEHWTPAMKDAARARMAEPEPSRHGLPEGVSPGITPGEGRRPVGFGEFGRRVVDAGTRAAPMAAGMMVGGPAGAALAAGLGAGGSAARDVAHGRPVSTGAALLEGGIEGGLGAVSPVAKFLGPHMKNLASAGLRKVTGIETKVGADAVLNAGRGGLTAKNAAALEKSSGQPGHARADTAGQFRDALTRYKAPGDKSGWSGAVDAGLAFANPWLLGAKKAIEYGVTKAPRIGSEAAQVAHNVGGKLEGVGGGPAQVARFLRMLLGGDEPE